MNMWSRMGVILSSGSVELAASGDISTQVSGVEDRINNRFNYIKSRLTTQEMINLAISRRDPRSYNEFIIDDPEIAGFYICADQLRPGAERVRRDMVPHIEIIKAMSSLNIPIFVIKEGRVYRSRIAKSADSEEVLVPDGEPITPEEITNLQINISDQKRKEARDRASRYLQS